MLEVGRLCIKTAGRDATAYCVVVEKIDEKYVLVDGNTRRKKVNMAHLEPLNKTLDVKKGADTKAVLEAFDKAGIKVKKSAEAKPKKEKKVQEKKAVAKKVDKKSTKKADKKAAKKESKDSKKK